MIELSAAERRFHENVTLIGAERLLFGKLAENGAQLFKLCEIADTASGGTPDRGNPSYFGGEIPWLKSGELNDGYVTEIEESVTESGLNNSNAKVFPAGTLLIALYGATVGKTGLLGIAAATNQAVCAILPKRKEVRVQYLHWFLRSKREEFLGNSFGGAQPNISQRILRDTIVPLPPETIQDAVTAFLEAIEQRMKDHSLPLPELPYPLTALRRAIERLEELATKVEEARTMRLETVQAIDTLVGTEIQRLFSSGSKAGWSEGHLGDYVVDDCYGTSEKTNDDSSGIPILRMGNIQNGHLDTRSLKYLRIKDGDRRKWILQDGDILVNRTNSAELVGKCAVFDLKGEYGFASYIIRLRLDTGRALPRLIAAYINSPIGRAYMFNERKQMTGQANINSKKLKALPIALPCPPEQHRTLAHLDDLQAEVAALKNLQSETAAELNALMPSILAKAFRGEL